MFDIGWQELFIVGVLAVIVIGPKDLPRAMRTVGGLVRKGRNMAREFQSSLDDMVREAEIDDIKTSVDSGLGIDMRAEIENTLDPTGDFAEDMDMRDIEADLDNSLKNADPAPVEAPVDTVEDDGGYVPDAEDDGGDDTAAAEDDSAAETPPQPAPVAAAAPSDKAGG